MDSLGGFKKRRVCVKCREQVKFFLQLSTRIAATFFNSFSFSIKLVDFSSGGCLLLLALAVMHACGNLGLFAVLYVPVHASIFYIGSKSEMLLINFPKVKSF